VDRAAAPDDFFTEHGHQDDDVTLPPAGIPITTPRTPKSGCRYIYHDLFDFRNS
jgi:hypothetical protein